jgi:hypothetical protein
MSLSPVIIFAFNRPYAFFNVIESLKQNQLSSESDLFIYVDGPRKKYFEDIEKIKQVQNIALSVQGFKTTTCIFSKTNKGLAKSIIEGVTFVIAKYGKAIVLEDDLIVSINFLMFMNEGLNRHEHESKVFSICGYTNKIKIPQNYSYDAYFSTRSSSWGWATWYDRWTTVDWELHDWEQYKKMKKVFNHWGGSDCFHMLRSVKEGWVDSWAIRFVFSEFLQNKLSLFPVISKIKNEGFDGNGANCPKWSRFKYEFDAKEKKRFVFPRKIELNTDLHHSAMSYHTILIRIWSKFMYIISDYKRLVSYLQKLYSKVLYNSES